jgi:CTP synthase
LPSDVRRKIALFCNVDEECVIDALDVESIYEVPLRLQAQHLDEIVCRKLDLPLPDIDLEGWRRIVDGIYNATDEVRIALVGKYTGLKDAYKSIIESFVHAGVTNGVRVEIDWVSAEAVADDGPAVHLSRADGVLIPGGFGERGTEGKIAAVRYAREKGIPFLGICLGLQVAVIEYARGVLGLNKAHSTELSSDTPDPVIALMSEQEGIEDLGGTMRLGTYPCELREGTLARRLYGKDLVQERHRHRYEVNNNYRDRLEAAGMIFSGVSPDGVLAEIVEIPGHPFFVGVQFHPELRSRPERVHPLFHGLIEAAVKQHRARTTLAGEAGPGSRTETEEA